MPHDTTKCQWSVSAVSMYVFREPFTLADEAPFSMLPHISITGSVRPSVCPSVRLSVGPSVGPSRFRQIQGISTFSSKI